MKGRRYFATGHGHKSNDHDHGHGGHDSHGHGHDEGHHEPYEVPHYTAYNNWTDSPELVAHQQRLNAIGLTNPWIRNYAWNYRPEVRKTWGWPSMKVAIFGGVKYGVVVAGAAIIFTEALMYYNRQKASKEDAHQEGDAHHH